ncbi:MAG: calcium/proton exchanger [Chloroflexi bacterium]|nr:calcium/proton exchanger [Chloroflexota bacterium]
MNERLSLGRDLGRFLSSSWLNVLLIFVPASIILDFAHFPPLLVFLTAALGIIPLAGLVGMATLATSQHIGPGPGGLLNATFGNATELIIALFALSKGLVVVVKASITGSILGNMLLVLGVSMLAGGWGRERQRFNRTTAGTAVAMLMLAVTALVMPAVWDLVVAGSLASHGPVVDLLSLLTGLVLLATYSASLVFSLVTHRELLAPSDEQEMLAPAHRLSSAVVLLLLATAFIALESEVLVGVLVPATSALGLTQLFVGVIVVAVIGNAAEHFTATSAATRGEMDLAFQVAIGASSQVALLVAPLLVLASYLFGAPMDLVFNPFEIFALFLAVLSVGIVTLDGESNWFEGIQLVAVYAILALAFFFVPG